MFTCLISAAISLQRRPRRATAALVNAVGTDAHFDDPRVWPGEVKDTPVSVAVMEVANAALSGLILTNGWEIVRHDARLLITGPESFWSVNAPASQVKKATILLEESHPLGRLWDIDVFCSGERLIEP